METFSRPERRHGHEWLLPVATIVTCLALFAGAGCRPSVDAQLEEIRQQLMSARLPDSIVSIAEASRDLTSDREVTVSGRIFANGMQPFEADEASFNIIDLPKPGHNHEDPGDCPFCKRELESSASAIVKLVDTSGEVIPIAADQLLGLQKNQDVVVSGKANLIGDVLIVTASSLHVLSDEDSNNLAVEQIRRRDADS
jgi:hypothetical protein